MDLRNKINEIIEDLKNFFYDKADALVWFGRSYWGSDEDIESTRDIDIMVVNADKKYKIPDEIVEKVKEINKLIDVAYVNDVFIKYVKNPAIIGMILQGYKIVFDKNGKVTSIFDELEKLIKNINYKKVVIGKKAYKGKDIWIITYANIR